ncbi:zinc finger BED domain-containing 4-like [Brachionus plicatilis]|uniref:Zinc finger BED domain-containing 4-like n=1 Tax=Brachionus plicatilis TaxID=10195 RepID=A0A3M7SCA8_BRAPC|nr:zinc finger BED domain-containing 4-like [Brachionus plicatilis]
MIDYLQGIYHFPCMGHIINTVVKNNLVDSSNDKLKAVITRCQLLKPFWHITKLLSRSNYVTCSVVYASVIRVPEILMIYESSHGFAFLEDLAKEMYNDLMDRCDVFFDNDLITAASFLDPRFKKFHFVKDDKKRDKLLSKAKNYIKKESEV